MLLAQEGSWIFLLNPTGIAGPMSGTLAFRLHGHDINRVTVGSGDGESVTAYRAAQGGGFGGKGRIVDSRMHFPLQIGPGTRSAEPGSCGGRGGWP